jgi:hypothetical protein
MSAIVTLGNIAAYCVMSIPGVMEGYCNFFGIEVTLYSQREMLGKWILIFIVSFALFRVALFIDAIIVKRKGGK